MKNWIKNHKKEIIVGGGLTLAAGLFYYKFGIKVRRENKAILQDISNSAKDAVSDMLYDKVNPIDIGIGEVYDYWHEDDYANMILNEIKVSDLGKVGEHLVEHIDGITEDTEVTSVLGFINMISNKIE